MISYILLMWPLIVSRLPVIPRIIKMLILKRFDELFIHVSSLVVRVEKEVLSGVIGIVKV